MARNAKSPDEEVINAAKKGLVDQVAALLAAGASPDAVDKYGLTALMWACRKGHTALIDVLLKVGATLDKTDRTNRTALHHAVLFKHTEALERLAQAGANLNAVDMHGCTGLRLANETVQYEIARLLLSKGAEGAPPDPGDVGIGIVRDSAPSSTMDLISLVQRFICTQRSPNPWGERGQLIVIFHQVGAFGGPDHDGMLAGRISPKGRTFGVEVAVPNSFMEVPAQREFVFGSLRQAAVIAADRFRRARIVFNEPGVFALIEKCETVMHSANVKGL